MQVPQNKCIQMYFTVCLKPRLNMLSFPEFPASRTRNYKHIQKPSKTRDHALTFAGFSTPKISRVTEGVSKTRGTLKQSKEEYSRTIPPAPPIVRAHQISLARKSWLPMKTPYAFHRSSLLEHDGSATAMLLYCGYITFKYIYINNL